MKTRFKNKVGVVCATWIVALMTGTCGVLADPFDFTQGDIVVSAYGNVGNAATNQTYIDGQSTPISLLEFNTQGTLSGTYTLPTTDGVGGSGNVGIVGEYGSSSEGTLQLTGDGKYLTIAGYSATPAFAGNYANANPNGALAQSASSVVPRVAAFIGADGTVNSSTTFNNIYSTNNPRSIYAATGTPGTTFYISGQGQGKNQDSGIYRTTVGNPSASPVMASTTTIYNKTDTRTIQAYNGNLYYSQDKSGGPTGIYQYNGMPTSSSATATLIIPGSNSQTGVNYSPEGFFFANSTTLYVADTGLPKNGGLSDGGIQKWVNNGAGWTLEYTLSLALTIPGSSETGFEAVAGEVVGSGADAVVELYGVTYTSTDAGENGLYHVEDVLDATSAATNEQVTLVQASGANSTFKGVSFAPTPEPSTWALVLVGSIVLMGAIKRRKATI